MLKNAKGFDASMIKLWIEYMFISNIKISVKAYKQIYISPY